MPSDKLLSNVVVYQVFHGTIIISLRYLVIYDEHFIQTLCLTADIKTVVLYVSLNNLVIHSKNPLTKATRIQCTSTSLFRAFVHHHSLSPSKVHSTTPTFMSSPPGRRKLLGEHIRKRLLRTVLICLIQRRYHFRRLTSSLTTEHV